MVDIEAIRQIMSAEEIFGIKRDKSIKDTLLQFEQPKLISRPTRRLHRPTVSRQFANTQTH